MEVYKFNPMMSLQHRERRVAEQWKQYAQPADLARAIEKKHGLGERLRSFLQFLNPFLGQNSPFSWYLLIKFGRSGPRPLALRVGHLLKPFGHFCLP